MPELDGFGLLAGSCGRRAAPATCRSIMLSARAGEEARVEGLAGRRGRLPGQAVLGARAGRPRRDAAAARRMRAARETQRPSAAGLFAHAPVGDRHPARSRARVRDGERAVPRSGRRARCRRQADARRAAGAGVGQGIVRAARPRLRDRRAVCRPVELPVSSSTAAGDSGAAAFRFRLPAAVRSTAGRTEGIRVVVHRRHRAVVARRARTANRDAENANRAKDEFLAMLGHELRNPLAPILTALAAAATARRRRRASASARSSSGRSSTWSAWSTICSTSRASRAARSSCNAGPAGARRRRGQGDRDGQPAARAAAAHRCRRRAATAASTVECGPERASRR